MSEPGDWNAEVIEEFRRSRGASGATSGAPPTTLVHHRGRTSGREPVTPMMYLPDDSDLYPVTVRELVGEERDRVYAEQARRYPGFAEYEQKTAGLRTMPVLALSRR